MSHSVKIATQFKDWNVLEKTFEALNWTIKSNQKCRTYPSDPSRDVVHQYIAVNPKANGYDVGIDVDLDGNAVFTCDFFDKSIGSQLGQNLKNVKQGYSLNKIVEYMNEEDLDYKIENLTNGQLKVIATK